ncbi:MAG: LysR family transcriptional regulator [Silicimonas sp.]
MTSEFYYFNRFIFIETIIQNDETGRMTFEQLRIFLVVAELQHVTRAARQLNLTQSAVSAAISSLETRYDVRLFDRIGRGVVLNSAGQVFVAEARRVMDDLAHARTFLAELSGVPAGRLTIAASQTVASYWMPQLLVRFSAQFPKVDLRLQAGNTETVERAVRQHEVDVGVVEGLSSDSGLLMEPVARDRLVLIVGLDHVWADGRSLDMRDLTETTWIMRETGSGTRAAFHNDLKSSDINPAELRILMELPSNEACLAAVAAGQSATVLSRRAAATAIEAGRLKEVELGLSVRHFTALRHPERQESLALRQLMAAFRSDFSAAPG